MSKTAYLLLGVLLSASSFGGVEPYKLEKLFAIKKGYDSNDNVEIVALAKLPNHCFRAHSYQLKKLSDFEYMLKFDVKKKEITPCENVQINDFSTPLYYTKSIDLGQLNKGEYNVYYESFSEVPKKVSFTVDAAMTSGVDDIEYAPVTNAFIPELVSLNESPMIILSGIFYSSCHALDHENIEVSKQDDVFVIIPKIKFLRNQSCTQNQRLLEGFVNLGPIAKPGTYLVHVRSQSGISVNKVFHVKKTDFNPQGR